MTGNNGDIVCDSELGQSTYKRDPVQVCGCGNIKIRDYGGEV